MPKYFNVILETSISASSQEEAEKFASENLSIVNHDGELYDVHQCRVVESQ